MRKVVLETHDITKSFYGNQVLTGVNFDCYEGEIHSLCGENGAGKSTLMKIISGIYKQTSGTFSINGEERSFNNTKEAQIAGVGIVHQEFNLVPYLTVMENIYLGRQPMKGRSIDYSAMKAGTEELCEELGIKIDPNALIKEITVAQQQMVEIMKCLSLNTNIIIMDEPTAALTQTEVTALFRVMRYLKDQGKTLIYISHRLNEIFEITDRITVLKDGVMTGTVNTKEATKEQVVSMMVGRDIENLYPERDNCQRKEKILEAKGLVLKKGKEKVDFDLYRGEIVGVSGLEGQGQREFVRALYGLSRVVEGKILVEGKEVTIKSPADAMKCGISFVTDDRKVEGLCLDQEIFNNISLPILAKLKSGAFLKDNAKIQASEPYMKKMNIKAWSVKSEVKTLSGGNQQKVLLSKALSNDPHILLIHEPTRGIDVAAKVEIYDLFRKLTREDNIAIVIVSSDLPEVINVSDRIVVMHDYHINGEVNAVDATEESLMKMAVNVSDDKGGNHV